MELQELSLVIRKSSLLTEEERRYWLGSISQMTPEQVSRLEEILTRANSLSWSEHLNYYVSLLKKKYSA